MLPSSQAQGTFQNLGFEAAIPNVPSDPPRFIPFTNAFPGWTGHVGPYLVTDALYNGITGALADISIVDRGSRFYSNNVIAGTYSAAISSGFVGTGFVSTAIGQTSLTPVTARSLRFSASVWTGQISDFAVTFDGQMLPLFALGSGTNFQVYGADISPFAGMVGELRFTVYPGVSPNTTVFLDSIFFSNQPIPEPSVYGLILCGAVISVWKRCRRRT